MAKFKAGDKVVLEISGVEMIGMMEANYVTTCGMRVKIADLDKAELVKEPKAEKAPAKKPAAKKTAKK